MQTFLILFGTILAGIVTVVGMTTWIVGIREDRRKLKFGGLAMTLVCAPLLVYGWITSYDNIERMVEPRGYANPPLDENNPENLIHLKAYLDREQDGTDTLRFNLNDSLPNWYYDELDTLQEKN